MAEDNPTGGRLEVIYGPMFSGKTEELIRRLRAAEGKGESVLGVKPALDERSRGNYIVSHTGNRHTATVVSSSVDLLRIASSYAVVGIDEAQFFDMALPPVLQELCDRGLRVIADGLDLDFARRPFGPMGALISQADTLDRLAATCHRCGAAATLTQRLVGGQPAPRDAVIIETGTFGLYEARCRRCYELEFQAASAIRA